MQEGAWGLSKGFGTAAVKKKKVVYKVSERASDVALLEWMKGEGAMVDKVSMADFSGLRGLVCTRDVKKGETVVGCPSALALALADPTKKGGAAKTQERAMTEAGLNLLQWYLEGPQGAGFARYLATLPSASDQFSPTPDFWDDATIEALEFAPTVRSAKKRKALVDEVAAREGVDPETLRFATWLASSRAFMLRAQASDGTGANAVPVLVPLLDMINHSPVKPNARMIVQDAHLDDATFAVVADRNIKRGTQILLAYRDGAASSADLLLDYGFVPNAPPVDADRRLLANHRGAFEFTTPRKSTLSHLQDPTLLDPNLRQALKFRAAIQDALRSLPSGALGGGGGGGLDDNSPASSS